MSITKRTRILAAVLATVLPFSTGVAQAAGSKTATFDVTMRVVADCTISAAGIDFGQTGVMAAAINGTSNINVTCTNTTPYNVGLDAGTGAGSTGTTRYMVGATGGNTDTVELKLFRQAGTGLWGNTQGSDTVGGTGNGVAQVLTVYGEIPKQKAVTPDTYKSTITATIYF
ncbi:spore coat U domain-containing protein [Massilia sp.]|uniref:Csu type fimbrial protein n=1 Tax=Massilia sp. TaxID=1882437 RepID=UPI00289E87B5|nr:spore coat U domain-containing protein [Massilia sp.]